MVSISEDSVKDERLSKKNKESARIFFLMSRKWMLHILRTLDNKEPRRFNEFIKESEFLKPKSLTPRTLSARLKELEKDEIIVKKSFNETPPRVEYSFTPQGKELVKFFRHLDRWAAKYKT